MGHWLFGRLGYQRINSCGIGNSRNTFFIEFYWKKKLNTGIAHQAYLYNLKTVLNLCILDVIFTNGLNHIVIIS